MRILLSTLLVCLVFACALAAKVPRVHQTARVPEVHEDELVPLQAHQAESDSHRIKKLNKVLDVLEKKSLNQRADIDELYDRHNAQEEHIRAIRKIISQLTNSAKNDLLGWIRNKGLEIGTRWKISQEGDGLVVRDVISTKNSHDSRYYFSKDTYHDL